MKAAWYETQGAPGAVLVVGEMPDPVPGPGEVRIRVAAHWKASRRRMRTPKHGHAAGCCWNFKSHEHASGHQRIGLRPGDRERDRLERIGSTSRWR